jgi:hypothetical protein
MEVVKFHGREVVNGAAAYGTPERFGVDAALLATGTPWTWRRKKARRRDLERKDMGRKLEAISGFLLCSS